MYVLEDRAFILGSLFFYWNFSYSLIEEIHFDMPVKMAKVINIHREGEQVNLIKGRNKIDILGGWGIKLGNFWISFRHVQTQEMIQCKKAFWPVQFYAFGKRSKRIFIVDAPKAGSYIIEFRNSKDLQVKPSSLFVRSLFEEPIPNKSIAVYIH